MIEFAISGTLAVAVAVLVLWAVKRRNQATLRTPQTRFQPTSTVKSSKSRDDMIDFLRADPRPDSPKPETQRETIPATVVERERETLSG